jgi:hypothetical protein
MNYVRIPRIVASKRKILRSCFAHIKKHIASAVPVTLYSTVMILQIATLSIYIHFCLITFIIFHYSFCSLSLFPNLKFVSLYPLPNWGDLYARTV